MRGAGVLRHICVLVLRRFTAHVCSVSAKLYGTYVFCFRKALRHICDTIHRKTLVLACEMNKYICPLCSRVSLTHTLGHTKRNIYPFLGRTSNVFSIE